MPIDFETASIAICSWENSWAKAGGLFAVVREYAAYIRKEQQRDGFILTPMHDLGGEVDGEDLPIEVQLGDARYDAFVRRVPLNGVDWFLIGAESFFTADGGRSQTSPYAYSGDSSKADESKLLRDSLFFSKAVPVALEALGKDNVLIHLQDWQTAPAVVAVKDRIEENADRESGLKNAAVVLTMHNPYDQALSELTWSKLTRRPFPSDKTQTVYRRTLGLLDAPPTTVSREFAIDLRSDGLQTFYFADQLQPVFSKTGIVGVDNGPFEEVRDPFPERNFGEVKWQSRQKMLTLLEEYQESETRAAGRLDGDSGGRLTTLSGDVPFFMMTGRLDPRQKGFDIFARAIREFLGTQKRDGRFLIATDPGDAPASFLEDLLSLGDEFPGRVLICAFRMQRAYVECQAGATFSVWPSLYEPFGGVSEFFLKGTPAVARTTGGLRQQVFDISGSPHGTGITYNTRGAETRGEWKAIMDAASPREREAEPLYQEHVQRLTEALVRATETYHSSESYERVLANLFPLCQQFSWARAWDEYSDVYQIAAGNK
jgi:glycogen synthase